MEIYSANQCIILMGKVSESAGWSVFIISFPGELIIIAFLFSDIPGSIRIPRIWYFHMLSPNFLWGIYILHGL